MPSAARSVELPVLDRAILHTLVYADVFDYPMRAAEIQRYLTGVQAAGAVVSARLDQLVPGTLRRAGDLFTLPGREEIVGRRLRREAIAMRLWPHALRYGRMIAGLPFVRMLAVTGSLAVDNVEAGADLDYLVVTTPGRLWLCRALILALARVARVQGLRLCPNYLISERALVFPDQTLYVAHELAQMVPLSGLDVYRRIRSLNGWVERFLPNADGAPPRTRVELDRRSRSVPQAMAEGLLSGAAGRWIEGWEMERKVRKLRLENANNPEASFSVDLCKGHNNRHGRRTENVLREKLEGVSLEYVQ